MHTKRIPQVCRHSRKKTKGLSKTNLKIGTKSRPKNGARRGPELGTIFGTHFWNHRTHICCSVFTRRSISKSRDSANSKISSCKDKNYHHRHNLHGQLAEAMAPALNSETQQQDCSSFCRNKANSQTCDTALLRAMDWSGKPVFWTPMEQFSVPTSSLLMAS